MKIRLHDTTLNLISLIHFYRRVSDNNKLISAINKSQALTLKGVEQASTKDKLDFCLVAVEAITTIFVENNSEKDLKKQVHEHLDREEIDFILNVVSADFI